MVVVVVCLSFFPCPLASPLHFWGLVQGIGQLVQYLLVLSLFRFISIFFCLASCLYCIYHIEIKVLIRSSTSAQEAPVLTTNCYPTTSSSCQYHMLRCSTVVVLANLALRLFTSCIELLQ